MPSPELERLADRRLLDREAASPREFAGLLASGDAFLGDAAKASNSLVSRFTLAYDAAHAFSLAALRRAGYRSDSRYLVFQCLEHTVAVSTETRRHLSTAHERRNRVQYEGVFEVSEKFLSDVIAATARVRDALRAASPEG